MNALTQTKPFTLPLLAAWAIASAIGITLGTIVTIQVLWSMTESTTADISPWLVPILAGSFMGLGVGLCTGLAQWLVLRQRGTPGPRWLVSTIVGSILGAIVAIAISNAFSRNGEIVWVNLVALALMGAILGTVQFLMTRDIVGHPAWIVASAVGLTGTLAILFGMGAEALGIGSGLIYGVITAGTLWWVANK